MYNGDKSQKDLIIYIYFFYIINMETKINRQNISLKRKLFFKKIKSLDVELLPSDQRRSSVS